MTTLMLPIELEPNMVVSMFDVVCQLNDDEFYNLCRANSTHKFERKASGDLLLLAPLSGEPGEKRSELLFELVD